MTWERDAVEPVASRGAAGRLGEVRPQRLEKLALYAAFLAIWGIWGSTYLAIEVAIETIPPLLMIGTRCIVSGLVLYTFARYRGAPGGKRGDWLESLFAGALLFLGGQGVLAWAEQRVESGSAALLNATIPMFVVLLGLRESKAKHGRIEWPSAPVVAGLGLGLIGVALTVGTGASGVDVVGAAALLFASLSWAAGVYRAGGGGERWPLRRAGMQLLAGGAALSVVAAGTGELSGFAPGAITSRSFLALVYLIVFGSLIAFSAFVWLLGRVDAAGVSSHAYVNPIVAVMLGALLGGEVLTANRIMGGLLIVFAVALIVTGGRHDTVRRFRAHRHPRRHDRARGSVSGGSQAVAQTVD